jgi:acetyl-CoA carboxylase carboxyltransferase component
MCGKAYDPRFIYAWPTAKIAVMGGEQAARTLLQIEVASLKSKGQEITSEKEESLLKEMMDKYAAQTTAVYAASRLWVDAIIDPKDTRKLISENLSAANHNPKIEEFKTGVLQV